MGCMKRSDGTLIVVIYILYVRCPNWDKTNILNNAELKTESTRVRRNEVDSSNTADNKIVFLLSIYSTPFFNLKSSVHGNSLLISGAGASYTKGPRLFSI